MGAEARNDEFRALLEPHRREITAHCYRMLGSLEDAEEVAQESLLRAWQRLDQRKSESATRAWLYKIATNACLDLLKTRRRRRTLPHLMGASVTGATTSAQSANEALWIEPAPDALFDVRDDTELGPHARTSMRESIGLAFITALQLLSAKQRAALLLVDVLGWRAQDAAKLLETTVVSVNSLLQRARKNIETQVDDGPPHSTLDDATLLQRYITTWESGDLDALTALLAEDALLSMPPLPEWYAGRDAIRKFLERVMAAAPRRYKSVPIRANGSPAVAVYAAPLTGGDYEAQAITVLAMRRGRIAQITRFALPRLFARFGLENRLQFFV